MLITKRRSEFLYGPGAPQNSPLRELPGLASGEFLPQAAAGSKSAEPGDRQVFPSEKEEREPAGERGS